MKVYASKSFTRFVRREGLSSAALLEAAGRVVAGNADADLGGGVFKQRVARAGEGKSGGYRTILLFRVGGSVFFVHGFAKSDKANIGRDELMAFRRAADVLTKLGVPALAKTVDDGELTEVGDVEIG